MSTKAMRVKCGAHNRGEQCGNWAVRGATVCRSHSGGAPQVAAKVGIRGELLNWGLTDAMVDPGEVLLKLVTQSAARAQRYAHELEALVDELPSLREALVADMWVQPEHGDADKAGDCIRRLAQLEAQERDRCANLAAKAIAVGAAERQVRLAERQGELMVTMVAAALVEAAVPDEYAAAFKVALAGQVRAIRAG